MKMHAIGWTIMIGLFVLLNLGRYLCRKYVKWAADYLVAGAVVVFICVYGAVCLYNLCYDVPSSGWLRFWQVYLYVMFALGSVFLAWITIGGIRDLIHLFRSLKSSEVNINDDGSVEGHHAAQ